MEGKKELRKEIRAKLKELTPQEKKSLSHAITLQLEQDPLFQAAETILFFWSLPDEVNTHELIVRTSKRKRILLPVVVGDDTEIRFFNGTQCLQKGAFNINEPVGRAFNYYDEIDLVIVPGMGFDSKGNRLGRGKGYYDKLLKKIDANKIAICFPCQMMNNIPHEEWDVPVDKVITAI